MYRATKTHTMLRYLLVLLITFVRITHSFSDIGKWDLPMNGDNCMFTLAKSLFQQSKLTVMIKCDVANTSELMVSYSWLKTKCSPDYLHYFEQQQVVSCSNGIGPSFFDNLTSSYSEKEIKRDDTLKIQCTDNHLTFIEAKTPGVPEDTAGSKTARHALITVDKEGIYVFRMTVSSKVKFRATVSVEMVAPSGYLSAAIWPLLPFFGVMCGIYTLLCTGWLLVCWLRWRDLLRIQYWIGGVALMGMVESATYYGLYSNINSTGYFNAEVYMFAEWISVAKRALARMLVIIVSLGFGIVK